MLLRLAHLSPSGSKYKSITREIELVTYDTIHNYLYMGRSSHFIACITKKGVFVICGT